MKKTICSARDFSRFPAGRHSVDGPYSGQGFRERILAPALKAHANVEVVLDGTLGFGSSFLEEAFGGLTRTEAFSLTDLRQRLTLTALEEPSLVTEIWSYIEKASAPPSGR